MMAWLAANWLTVVSIAAVLGLAILSLRNILPRKGKAPACAGCAGCSGCSCAGRCPRSGREAGKGR